MMTAERFWLAEAARRIEAGRKQYGNWKAKDGRILRFEASLEIIDATAYMAAAATEAQYDPGDDIEALVLAKQARIIEGFFERGMQLDACGILQMGYGEYTRREGK
jgi:hypothetical protein